MGAASSTPTPLPRASLFSPYQPCPHVPRRRCQKDYWLTVFVTFTLSFFVDVVLFDPFMIAALYTLQARRTTNELAKIHEARASMAGDSTGSNALSERSDSVVRSDNHIVSAGWPPMIAKMDSGASATALRGESSPRRGAAAGRMSCKPLVEPESPRQVKSGGARLGRSSIIGSEGPPMLAHQASSDMYTERV